MRREAKQIISHTRPTVVGKDARGALRPLRPLGHWICQEDGRMQARTWEQALDNWQPRGAVDKIIKWTGDDMQSGGCPEIYGRCIRKRIRKRRCIDHIHSLQKLQSDIDVA